MGRMCKALMDELSSEVAAHAHNAWEKKAVRDRRVQLIVFDNMEIDVVKFFLMVVWTV